MEERLIKRQWGTVLGVEGAYFFNRNLGFGGRTTFSNIQLIVNDTASPDNTVTSIPSVSDLISRFLLRSLDG